MIKWQWFLGGKGMFWFSIIVFWILIFGFLWTYILDPTTCLTMKVQKMDTTAIQSVSTDYVNTLHITVDKPIVYRFVKYNCNDNKQDGELLGSFHEWNGKYYIDISMDICGELPFEAVVIHETRHMIVDYLKDEHIINLYEYTEEIAQEKNLYYNNLFNSGVYLLRSKQNTEKK